MHDKSFTNKVAIITGSSQGIGKTLALELLKLGAKVVINGRDERKLQKTLNELKSFEKNVIPVAADIADPNQAAKLITETILRFGKIDILVNNAGLSMKGSLIDLNPEVYKRVFDANIMGSVNTTIPALPYLRKSKGSVVFISSVAGIRGLPGHSAYCSSKMALRAIAESLRIEEAASGIHVGLIYVGFTQNEPEKRTISADGSLIEVDSRANFKPQTQYSVAIAVLRNIRKRRFISTLSKLGKLNRVMQTLSPSLVEKILSTAYSRKERQNLIA